jgi:hypothetical protein
MKNGALVKETHYFFFLVLGFLHGIRSEFTDDVS